MPLTKFFVTILNRAHNRTWADFKSVKHRATQLGLDKNKITSWKGPGEPALAYRTIDANSIREIELHLHDVIQHYKSTKMPSVGDPLLTTQFIHQKPKIVYNDSGKDVEIELGDLLFIRHHFTFGNTQPEGRAFILQAKANNNPSTGGMSKDEEKQLKLYCDWSKGFIFPNGEYPRPVDPANQPSKWIFTTKPQSKDDCTGIYGVVLSEESTSQKLNDFPDGCVWGIGLPGDVKQGKKRRYISVKDKSLASALSELIEGSYGRPWNSTSVASTDHWSQFINTVLATNDFHTSQAALQRIATTGEKFDRHRQVLAFASKTPGLVSLIERDILSKRAPMGSDIVINWLSSVGFTENGTAPPSKIDDRPMIPTPRKGGMSFIYIATFGDKRLSQQ